MLPKERQGLTTRVHYVAAANEARAYLRDATAKFDAVDADRDLSPEGRQRQRAKIANETVAKMKSSKTPSHVQEVVDQVMQKYQAKIDGNLQRANDAQQIAVFAQIRDRLHSLTEPRERMKFLEKHGSALTPISAVLTAPVYLSGLSDDEYKFVRAPLERHAPPDIIKQRDFTQRAAAEVQRGWRAVAARIEKRAGLHQGNLGDAAIATTQPTLGLAKQTTKGPSKAPVLGGQRSLDTRCHQLEKETIG